MEQAVLVDVADGILTITLNRPDKLNALDIVMRDQIYDALDRADADDDVRVVILTGTGRAFCAGADISANADADSPFREGDGDPALMDESGRSLALRIFAMKKPVIAAINGFAIGWGLSFILPCDIRICASNARLSMRFIRMGVLPEEGSGWFLPRIVGISQALRWCLTGEFFEAPAALAAGLVSELHEPDDLLPAARAIARQIADNAPPVSAAITRQLLWKMLGAGHPRDAMALDKDNIAFIAQQPDAAEAFRSFAAKETPRWTGRVSTDLPAHFPWESPGRAG